MKNALITKLMIVLLLAIRQPGGDVRTMNTASSRLDHRPYCRLVAAEEYDESRRPISHTTTIRSTTMTVAIMIALDRPMSMRLVSGVRRRQENAGVNTVSIDDETEQWNHPWRP